MPSIDIAKITILAAAIVTAAETLRQQHENSVQAHAAAEAYDIGVSDAIVKTNVAITEMQNALSATPAAPATDPAPIPTPTTVPATTVPATADDDLGGDIDTEGGVVPAEDHAESLAVAPADTPNA